MMSIVPTDVGPASVQPSPGPDPSALRVLLVEDNPGDAELVFEALGETGRDGPAFSPRCVTRLAEVGPALAEWPADVILLDLSLPDGRGLASLAAVRATAPEVPVVVMTGLADDEVALRAVQAGAQDYLLKGRDDGGVLRRAVLYAIERQRLVRAVRHAVAARDEVLAVVSHDLRNPLSTIAMCAQALREPASVSPDGAREIGQTIHDSCDWMLRLIGDLLDVTRLEAGTLALDAEAVPIVGVLDTLATMFRPLAAGRDVALATTIAPDLPPLRADADRLVQALGNLVGNAIKFTPAGGRVTVAAEPDKGLGASGVQAVRLRVVDTGRGIAAEHLPHVFDRFWQARDTRRGGAGLGLAIARGIVEAHGGTIAVESTLGVGTTFTCTLPAAPAGDAGGRS